MQFKGHDMLYSYICPAWTNVIMYIWYTWPIPLGSTEEDTITPMISTGFRGLCWMADLLHCEDERSAANQRTLCIFRMVVKWFWLNEVEWQNDDITLSISSNFRKRCIHSEDGWRCLNGACNVFTRHHAAQDPRTSGNHWGSGVYFRDLKLPAALGCCIGRSYS